MKKTIIYILSTNYAGSHFLSLMLGSHSRAMHLGELKRLRKAKAQDESKRCYICKKTGGQACPVFNGVDAASIDTAYDIVFSNIKDAGVDVLIDNSKKPFWAERFLNKTPYSIKCIHLIRDPRALVRRWLLRYNTPAEKLNQRLKTIRDLPALAPRVAFMPDAFAMMYKWLAQNMAITAFIKAHSLEHTLVTYQDLALDSVGELKRLGRWAGLEYEPGQEQYWRFIHHGTQKYEYEWIKEKSESHYFDLRWKEFLSSKMQGRMKNNRQVLKYIEKLGLIWADNGLTQGSSVQKQIG